MSSQPYTGTLIEDLITLVNEIGPSPNSHIHFCFGCIRPFRCACTRTDEYFICEVCDGETYA